MTNRTAVVVEQLGLAPAGVFYPTHGRIDANPYGLHLAHPDASQAVTDYVVRPRIVGKHGHTHPLLTLVSLVGGVLAFGLPGLVAGPLIVSLFAATLRIYERHAASRAPG